MTRVCRAVLCGVWLLLAAALAAGAAEYGATYTLPTISPVNAGQLFTVTVTVTNTGTREWKKDACVSKTAFRLAYHWDGGPAPLYEGERKPVNKTVKPGEKVTLELAVLAPSLPGDYTLQLDMIEEGVTWFSTSTDQVKTGNIAVKVNPAPAQPKVTGLAFDFSPVSKGYPVKVFVKRDGACAYQLNFGNGQTATGSASTPGSVHTYTQDNTFTVTATGTGGCTGQATAQLKVETPLTLCWLCANGFCGEFFGPPKIQSLSTSSLKPGTIFIIEGSGFGTGPGQVILSLTDFKGEAKVIPLQVKGGWSSKILTAQVPPSLGGVRDQLATVHIVRGNVVSDKAFAVFHPALVTTFVPRSMITVEACEQEVACNSCNDKKSGSCFMFDSTSSINGYHLSEAFLCIAGGGFGADTYSINLKNGWTLSRYIPWQLVNAKVHGFEKGSTSVKGSVGWSVGTCGHALYEISLEIVGPRGVPFQ
jgi:hypothetical protein